MSSNIKKNFGFNLILTCCNYLFPLITFPYVSRVLGVEKIGMCNFVDSIINYFVLFSMLGIGSLGVREIARCKDDEKRRSQVFSNLIVWNIIFTLIAISVLLILIYVVGLFAEYKPFLLIGICKLAVQPFCIEWFFKGIQNFKYITIRSVAIRLLYVLSLFIFVRKENDVETYYLLVALTLMFNAICNWGYSHRFCKLSLRGLSLSQYIVPILVFGYYLILTSLYTTFNTFFLGVTSGNVEVGYFSAASKINTLIMSVFSALTTTMVPKVAELLHNGERDRLQKMANVIFSGLTIVALPIIAFCIFCAPQIIVLIAGNGYEGAIPVFRIVVSLILIIGIEQIVIQQFLMASTNNKSIFLVSTVGAVVGLFLNFILTPWLYSVGSAIAWTCSELAVLITGLVLFKRIIGLSLQIKFLFKNILYALLYVGALLIVSICVNNDFLNLFVSGIVTLILFVVINVYLQPNEQVVGIFRRVIKSQNNCQQ